LNRIKKNARERELTEISTQPAKTTALSLQPFATLLRSGLLLVIVLIAMATPFPAHAETVCDITPEKELPCTARLAGNDGSDGVRITFLSIEVDDDFHPQARHISVRIENAGETPFEVDPARFIDFDDGEGFAYRGSADPVVGLPAAGKPLPVTELQPGEKIEGDVWFRTVQPTWMFYYLTDDNRLVPLAVHSPSAPTGAGLRPTNRIGRGRG
jgi:hypothetical protein